VATLRLFAQAREAAGVGALDIAGTTVGDVIDSATDRFGAQFETIVAGSKIWVNGQPAERVDGVGDGDEVAILPPVSGGA